MARARRAPDKDKDRPARGGDARRSVDRPLEPTTSSTSARSRSTISSKTTQFKPVGHDGGPYALQLGITGNRLVFDIRLTDGTPVIAHMLSLAPFRRIVKDYFMVCDSYYAAIRTATPDRIEALDMGRRGCTTKARSS